MFRANISRVRLIIRHSVVSWMEAKMEGRGDVKFEANLMLLVKIAHGDVKIKFYGIVLLFMDKSFFSNYIYIKSFSMFLKYFSTSLQQFKASVNQKFFWKIWLKGRGGVKFEANLMLLKMAYADVKIKFYRIVLFFMDKSFLVII